MQTGTFLERSMGPDAKDIADNEICPARRPTRKRSFDDIMKETLPDNGRAFDLHIISSCTAADIFQQILDEFIHGFSVSARFISVLKPFMVTIKSGAIK